MSQCLDVNGAQYYPGYLNRVDQLDILAEIEHVIAKCPFFTPTMPGTGTPFSVKISNCGDLGWVSDKLGYRYQSMHPQTKLGWPPIPARLCAIWKALSAYHAPAQACLINLYQSGAKMGAHQDRDERELMAPVVSISLGDRARFFVGGPKRNDPKSYVELRSGDVIVLAGPSRLSFHGVSRVYDHSSNLLENSIFGHGRINLTLRRVDIEPK